MSGLETRTARSVVIVVTANKLARISWAVLASGNDYQSLHKSTAWHSRVTLEQPVAPTPIIAMFGFGILVLPGFVFFVASAFAVDVMTNEEAGVVRALECSISLVGDRIGTVFTLVVALGVIAGVLGTVFLAIWAAANFEGFAAAAIMWSSIGIVPPALITVYATLISLLYCDVRVQRGELQPTSRASG